MSRYIKDDKLYISLRYYAALGKRMNWKNPQTFNEKLQWLKLYDRKPIYTTMVDKYEVKKYVADIIGEEHIIPTLAVYDRPEDIDFDALPNRFVLKCTHDSGSLVICRDKSKLDREAAVRKLAGRMNSNYYYWKREWPYKNVKPRIIAEKYMEDGKTQELRDYKFFCFDGTPKVILLCRDRYKESGLTEDFYDVNWNHLAIKRPEHPNARVKTDCPKELKIMVDLSKKLAKDVPFVRTDFYTINNEVYFGELTFFPASGTTPFIPEEWDYILGEWLNLPSITKSDN